jgi:hypothetical protein
MTDHAESTGARDRSPAYPIIPLKAAIDRLAEFDVHFKRSAARPEKIGDAWGIKGKAYVDRTTAALKYFGLLEYQGTGSGRQIAVSDEGRKYLRAQQEETKQLLLKAAALRPRQIAKFWEKWGRDRPADPACIDELTFHHGFSDKGARDFLRVYDDTITFARLSSNDIITSENSQVEAEEEEDLQPMTPTPSSEAGKTRPTAPPSGGTPFRVGQNFFQDAQPPGTRREVITLDEGDAVITFPENLSAQSFGDLKAHLDLFIKKMQRRAGLRSPEFIKKAREVLEQNMASHGITLPKMSDEEIVAMVDPELAKLQ